MRPSIPASGQLLDSVDRSLGRNLNRGPSARLNLTWTPNDKDQVTAAASYNEQVLHGHPDDSYVIDGANGNPTSIFDRPSRRRYLETDNSVSAGWKHSFGEGTSCRSTRPTTTRSRARDHTLLNTVITTLPSDRRRCSTSITTTTTTVITASCASPMRRSSRGVR